jgi:hypothetical protein
VTFCAPPKPKFRACYSRSQIRPAETNLTDCPQITTQLNRGQHVPAYPGEVSFSLFETCVSGHTREKTEEKSEIEIYFRKLPKDALKHAVSETVLQFKRLRRGFLSTKGRACTTPTP